MRITNIQPTHDVKIDTNLQKNGRRLCTKMVRLATLAREVVEVHVDAYQFPFLDATPDTWRAGELRRRWEGLLASGCNHDLWCWLDLMVRQETHGVLTLLRATAHANDCEERKPEIYIRMQIESCCHCWEHICISVEEIRAEYNSLLFSCRGPRYYKSTCLWVLLCAAVYDMTMKIQQSLMPGNRRVAFDDPGRINYHREMQHETLRENVRMSELSWVISNIITISSSTKRFLQKHHSS